MFHDMEKLKIISVLSGTSGVSRTFSKRPWHGLVFRISGTFSYRFAHGELQIGRAHVLNSSHTP